MKNPTLEGKLRRLEAGLRDMGRVLIAFSGGVDSSLLLKVAAGVLGSDVVAVIAASETYPEGETRAARALARRWKVRHEVIRTAELDDPDFAGNPPLRCYHCKKELWRAMKAIAGRLGIPHVLDGSNTDDADDYRPGSAASREMGVRSPLREAGLSKADIRALSRRFGLPTWNKPSLACLASRFPYGTPIDRETLRRVGTAEAYLRRMGFGQLRVRHHGDIARIEIDPSEFSRLLKPEMRAKIVARLKRLGYLYPSLDLRGYRTGSLNEGLKKR